VPQATAFAEPKLPALSDSEAMAPDATLQVEGFEMAAIAVNPAQPASPSADVPSAAFEAPDARVEDAPSAVPQTVESETPATEDVQTPAQTQAFDKAQEAVGPGPRVAQAANQALQEPVVEVGTTAGLIPADEALPPELADAAALPAPEGQEAVSDEDNSRNAQVTAKLQVDTPSTARPADVTVPLPTPASAAPVRTGTASLPDVARTETVVEADTDSPAASPEILQTQEQSPAATPAPRVAEAEVRVNRLPSLADAEPAPQEQPVPAETVEVPSDASDDRPPVQRYSAEFDGSDGKPMMAVVLMDDGVELSSLQTGMDVLSALPYPVSVAIDALLPDAADRMAAYRAAGFEVLAAIDLPEGAQATDAEVTISVALENLPEIFAVLEGTQPGVQTTPMAGRQVVSILAQTGHGFVSQNRGLNTVQKLAVREGVPARTVFRDLDSQGQTEVVIRRFMDQAAFRAAQDGGVIMLGRLRPETLSALVSWSLQDRASTVAMAPASAVLLQD
ncbi:MAG: divergent polysaccharide deacetylase family protein, partial [Roseobacter sp.]|nr:divergent polysaccharide deacetylase family protein [Roseobacter sp.]